MRTDKPEKICSRKSAIIWFDVTLNMGSRKEGLAGYSAWGGNEKGWVKEYDLLEGIAGIGLLLLSLYIPAPQNTKWMNFFLL